jgi:tetratricopeptide (TPR) repeat protein
VSLGQATFWDWGNQGDRLVTASKFKDAGNAYATGANLNGPYTYWCSAATFYSVASENDLALSSARECIELGIGKEGSDSYLATAHEEIAEILNDRAVYYEGLSHSKEATVLAPKDPFGFDSMSVALRGLHRPQEAIVAAQHAIVLSDGKYGSMHFHLAAAYFDIENWESARESYQKSAELDLQDSASAYNMAACYQRQGNWLEAAHWYEEYLRRAPNASDRAEVLDRIRTFRGAR